MMEKQIIKKKHRKYDAGFKQEAIKLVQAGRSVAEVSRSLGIGENLLYKWRNDAKTGVIAADTQQSNETDLLRKQVRQLEQARDILKKSLDYFQSKNIVEVYQVIRILSPQYPVRALCKSLKVSFSAYYAWKREESHVLKCKRIHARRTG